MNAKKQDRKPRKQIRPHIPNHKHRMTKLKKIKNQNCNLASLVLIQQTLLAYNRQQFKALV
jgi:hypothetical protein